MNLLIKKVNSLNIIEKYLLLKANNKKVNNKNVNNKKINNKKFI